MLFHSKKGFLMVLGYIRVSTESQSVLNQKHKILEFAQQKKIIVDEFIEIEISSKKSQKARLLDDLFTQLSHINFSKNTSKNQSNKAHK